MNVIDWTALATLALAAVTAGLAWQVRGQTRAARDADRARQRETHLLTVQPLLFREPVTTGPFKDQPQIIPVGMLYAVHTGDQPILYLTVTLRGSAKDGSGISYTSPASSVAPADEVAVRLEIRAFLELDTGLPWGGRAFEVVASYFGLFGQWVNEHYEWDYNARLTRPADPAPVWRLYRFEIEPRGVPGASSIDLRFGGPPKFV